MDNCTLMMAGYPACAAAIVTLWVAYRGAVNKLIQERHSSEQVWNQLEKIVKKREETRRGGSDEPKTRS